MGCRKLRILFLINNLGEGGAERVLVNLVNRMDSSKYEVTLRVLFDEGSNRARLLPSINYEFVFPRAFKGVNILGKIPGRFVYNWIVKGDYDVVVVYLHGVLTKIVASAPPSQRTIAYLHADMNKSPFMKSFKRRKKINSCFFTYDAIVSVSQSVEDSFRSITGMNDRLYVIHNVFDVDMIRDKGAEEIDRGLFFDPPVINICSVGKLTQVKGYDRLLRIASELRDEGMKLNLLIVGDGPQREVLQQYIDEKALGDCVRLVGYDENPYKYISRCDLFVSSSYSEGFSSVVVESIVLGVPVLATECSGMKEILGENQDFGMVVDNSEVGLRNGLREFVKAPGKLECYRGRAIIRSEAFSPQRSVSEFEKLINEVVNDGSSA